MAEENFEEIPMNPIRVCDAISKIGYQTYAAIEDIVDNSISADANFVKIQFDKKDGKRLVNGNNTSEFRIIDNGNGMDNNQIKKALMLGSDVEYNENSLSKYGLGLKSAGFSLGDKITVVSIKGGNISKKYYLDKDVIRDKGSYLVCSYELEGEEKQKYMDLIGEKGTIIQISNCDNVKNDSISKTLDKLKERLGVVYFEFLEKEENSLKLEIEIFGENQSKHEVKGRDILFIDKAKENYVPDHYDYSSPYLGLTKTEIPLEGCDKPIYLELVFFPQDRLRSCVKLPEEDRKRIKEYQISQKNKGFFIYRNGRLIRWGDSLDIINREHITCRARLSFSSDHDEVLHVDVSKQNLNIPEDILEKIEDLVSMPKKSAKEAYDLCTKFYEETENTGGFNLKNQYLDEDDEDEDDESPEEKETVRIREKNLIKKDKEKKDKDFPNEEALVTVENGTEKEIFQKVRYSDCIMGNKLWDSGFDGDQGNYVRINSNHSYYNLVFLKLMSKDPIKQSVEALFYTIATTENHLLRKYKDLNEDELGKVLGEFKRVFSNNIDKWSLSNQDLFDKDGN